LIYKITAISQTFDNIVCKRTHSIRTSITQDKMTSSLSISDHEYRDEIQTLQAKLIDIENREHALQSERQEVEKQLQALRSKTDETKHESYIHDSIHNDNIETVDICVSYNTGYDVQSISSDAIPSIEHKYSEYAEYKPKVDVIFARGNPGKHDEGTLFYRRLNDTVRPYYQAFPEKTKDKGDQDVHKSRVSQLVFDVITNEIRGQFLEKRGDLYILFKEESVKPKIKQALSEKKQKKYKYEKTMHGSESTQSVDTQLKKYEEELKKDPNFTTKFKSDYLELTSMWNELMVSNISVY